MRSIVIVLTLTTACTSEPDFDFAMLKQGQLTAQVTDTDDQPVSGAVVGLRMLRSEGRWAWITRGPTDANGFAVLRFTAPLGYDDPMLVAWHPDYAMNRAAVDLDAVDLQTVHLEPDHRRHTPPTP